MNIYDYLEEVKEHYEELQQFEVIKIETIPLDEEKKMISFRAYGNDDKNLCLFSLVSNGTFPVKLICQQYSRRYQESDFERMKLDIDEQIKERVKQVEEYIEWVIRHA